MKSILSQVTEELKSSYQAAMDRHGASPTAASTSDPNEDVMANVVALFKSLNKAGQITPKDLDEVKQAHKLLGQILQAANGGKLEVDPAAEKQPIPSGNAAAPGVERKYSTERPKSGSWYDQQQRRQPGAGVNEEVKKLTQIVALNPDAFQQVKSAVLAEYRKRSKESNNAG